MRYLFEKTYGLLDGNERFQLKWLVLLMVLQACLEVVSIGSILPFMRLLEDSGNIHGTPYLKWAYTAFGFENDKAFLMVFGTVVLVLFVLVNVVNALGLWAQSRFTWMRSFSISRRLLAAYLSRPYSFFLSRNSADFNRSIYQEVRQVIIGIMIPSVRLLSRGLSIVLIMALLLYVNPLLSLGIAILFSSTYAVIFTVSRHKLKEAGERIVKANAGCYRITNEAFGGIKQAKLAGLEKLYADAFTQPGLEVALMNTRNAVIGGVPRYLLEIVAFGSMLALLLIMIGFDYELSDVIPVASVFVFAGYRLMPAISMIFISVAQIRSSTASLDVVTRDIAADTGTEPLGERAPRLPMREAIRLDSASLRYPGSDHDAMRDVSLTIRNGETVAVVGPTGSGKSTLMDVLLGLLQPTSGEVLVDDLPLAGPRVGGWQRGLGYVPQSIFLNDDTVLRNIAFGVPDDEIDLDRVRRSASTAGIDEFISNQLREGYETRIGERGVRLSGGQLQRIGLARALYGEPSVLFLDEATSALDSRTEDVVMKGIRESAEGRTVVMIAHRLSTVRFCDRIAVMEDGCLVDVGTWEELVGRSELFRNLIGEQQEETQ